MRINVGGHGGGVFDYVAVNELEHNESDCKVAAAAKLIQVLGERYIIRVEYRIKALTPGRRGARLDIAVLDKSTGKIALIIEVKRNAWSKAVSQGRRYADLTGAPVIYLRGMEQAERAVEHVCAALKIGIPGIEPAADVQRQRVLTPSTLEPNEILKRLERRADMLRAHRDKLSGGQGGGIS